MLVAEKQPAELAPRIPRIVGMISGAVCADARPIAASDDKIDTAFIVIDLKILLFLDILTENTGSHTPNERDRDVMTTRS